MSESYERPSVDWQPHHAWDMAGNIAKLIADAAEYFAPRQNGTPGHYFKAWSPTKDEATEGQRRWLEDLLELATAWRELEHDFDTGPESDVQTRVEHACRLLADHLAGMWD